MLLRSVLQPATRRLSLQRTFVSTVLLSRTWENETVVALRKEAKLRGLSTCAPPPQNPSSPGRDVPGASRKVSSRATPASDPASPPPPQAVPSSEQHKPSVSAEFFAFKMPDSARPTPPSSAQVPYLPDFWDSAKLNSTVTESEPEPPKLHVVGGAATHHDGGPTYLLEKHSEADTVQSVTCRRFSPILGIPTTMRLRPVADTTVVEPPIQTRSLNREEVTGLYALLGILVGSWALGGILSPRPTVEDESVAVEEH
ncbi:hypothetical protein F5J12DRAFT_807346 [Pisolithus orientalis]|uniref:uncharacterized protein n=1 Tax=Pisolithus orientalis TaxID=936130 RepID=UPI00222467A6|nr:uncharacterized protein F5J12DRAFT_807346 [Pisolithus orientalis]KAI6028732.1 hypothetical protein F5J12DRAFT_807346 [Pisolithus orientalis]